MRTCKVQNPEGNLSVEHLIREDKTIKPVNADETPLRTMAKKLFIPETNAKNMVIKESKQDPFGIKHGYDK